MGVAAQLVHPTLKGALAEVAIAWRRKCAKHEQDAKAVSLQHHDDEEISALPMGACIAPSLLGGLAAVGALAGKAGAKGASSEGIQHWLSAASEV